MRNEPLRFAGSVNGSTALHRASKACRCELTTPCRSSARSCNPSQSASCRRRNNVLISTRAGAFRAGCDLRHRCSDGEDAMKLRSTLCLLIAVSAGILRPPAMRGVKEKDTIKSLENKDSRDSHGQSYSRQFRSRARKLSGVSRPRVG